MAAAAVAEAEAESTGVPKRHAPITFENSPPKARQQQQQQQSGNRQPYVVPNGKFSSNVSSGSGIYNPFTSTLENPSYFLFLFFLNRFPSSRTCFQGWTRFSKGRILRHQFYIFPFYNKTLVSCKQQTLVSFSFFPILFSFKIQSTVLFFSFGSENAVGK